MVVTVTSNFTVEKDEVYETSDGSYVFYFSARNPIVFDNLGTIRATNKDGAAIAINSDIALGTIQNHGSILAEGKTYAHGVYVSQWMGKFLNDGLVQAKADIVTGMTSYYFDQVVENRGTVIAWGEKQAEGFSLHNGGAFTNSGNIQAVGVAAIGVHIDRFEGGSFVNSGLIYVTSSALHTATSSGGGSATGLRVSGLTSTPDGPNIINYGTITAEVAIDAHDSPYSGPQLLVANVLNKGSLNGLITLGPGADIFVNEGTVRGNILMGDGADLVQLKAGAVIGVIDMGDGDDTAIGGPVGATIQGGLGRDTLTGGAGDDRLDGGAGSDKLDGGEGSDAITGGTGGDVIFGQGGADALYGGTGDDLIDAGAGDDVMSGDEGQDTISGGEGRDLIQGGDDFDQINGNQGDDTAHGGEGGDWVVGGKDQDLLYGDNGDDVVYGNIGNDTCYGGEGADWVRGGQGDDVIDGGNGNDWMAGDRGNDTVTGGAGADRFYFFAGAAIDRVTDFSSAAGDRVLLDAGQAYTLSYSMEGAIIDLGNGDQMILVGVTQASLGDWLVI